MGILDGLKSLLGSRKPKKVLVISDIHANASALKAVTKQAEQEGFTDVICLGDLTGYGAQPNEAVEEVRRLEEIVAKRGGDFTIISGNGDYYVLSEAGKKHFQSKAHKFPATGKTIDYGLKSLKPGHRDWLRSRTRLKSQADFFMVAFLLSDPKKDVVWDPQTKQYHFKWSSKNLTKKDRELLEKMGFKQNPQKALEQLSVLFRGAPSRYDAELMVEGKPVHLSHGGPGPLYQKRVSEKEEKGKFTAEQAFSLLREDVREILGGHDHVTREFKTKEGKRFIQVGSVGASFAEKPGKAHYAVIRGRTKQGELDIEHKEADYDVNETIKALDERLEMPEEHKQVLKNMYVQAKSPSKEEAALLPPKRKSLLRRLLGV